MTAKKTAPKGDATLREFSGYTMKRAFHEIQGDINAELAPLGLRMLSFSALVVIVDNPGLRQSHLADALMIERPNLVIVVDELERRELISRDPAPDDRRAYALRPTDAGLTLYDQAIIAVRAHEARMTKSLSKAEHKALITALRQIETARNEET